MNVALKLVPISVTAVMMTTAILKARRRARKRIEVVDLVFKLRADCQYQISFVAYTEFTCVDA